MIGLSVVPAVPPSPPTPPSLPPLYENTTVEDQDITVVEIIPIVPPPPLPVEPSDAGSGEISIDFVIPTEMRVTMEPHPLVCIIVLCYTEQWIYCAVTITILLNYKAMGGLKQ